MSRNKNSSMRARRGPRAARGFALLEVLIAGLVFSVGVLGVVGLHASMSKQQAASKYRAEAIYLAGEIIGTMWSDQPNLASYAGTTCNSGRCGAWAQKLRTLLPSGSHEITVGAGGAVEITISWTNNNGETQTYRTQTAVVL